MGEYYFMPGIATGSQVSISYGGLGKEYANTQRKAEVLAEEGSAKIWAFVRDVFTQTSKKYYKRYYYITAKGELLGRSSEEDGHTGFAGTYDYRLVCDGRFKQYASQLKTIASLLPEKGKPFTEYQSQALVREQKSYDGFFVTNPTPADFIVRHGMNEVNGVSKPDNCLTFAQWYRDRIYHVGPAAGSPADECFYQGRNQVAYEEALKSIDMLGIALAPFGLDWVADGLGCIYSGYYADFTNVGIYSSGVFIPAVSAGSLKGLTKETVLALRSGKAELVRENGEAVIRFIRDGADDVAKMGREIKYLSDKGFSSFEVVDDVIIFRDANNRLGKVSDKTKLDDVTWFTPQSGNTWLIHETNVTDYLKFKYGNKVSTQVKVRTYHKNGQIVDGYLDDLVETSNSDLLIIDAKHSQKAQIVDGKIPGYTSGQTQTYQWITDGDAVKIEIIGDRAARNGLPRGTDILPRLKGKIGIITNDANGQMVELSVQKTTK